MMNGLWQLMKLKNLNHSMKRAFFTKIAKIHRLQKIVSSKGLGAGFTEQGCKMKHVEFKNLNKQVQLILINRLYESGYSRFLNELQFNLKQGSTGNYYITTGTYSGFSLGAISKNEV